MAEKHMDYNVQTIAEGLQVNLSGRMTLVDHDKFRAVVDSVEQMSGKCCVFDLSGLEFIDSSGLGMFLIARDVALQKQIEVRLQGARNGVKRILEIAKFESLFNVTE